tara:strand:+ start:161 stop:388 length:228 start_codon:yes stop_codon:yes gene_type:complete
MIHEADLKRLAWKEPDYSTLNEKDFIRVLKDFKTISELEGMANRRKWLNKRDLPLWNKWQAQAILTRKWEIENGG